MQTRSLIKTVQRIEKCANRELHQLREYTAMGGTLKLQDLERRADRREELDRAAAIRRGLMAIR